MKELRLFLIVAISVLFFQNQVSAQCTPDTTLTEVGLYPDSLVGSVGVPFQDTLQAVLPVDTLIEIGGGSTLAYFCNYKIDSLTLDDSGVFFAVDDLINETGLSVECDQADCEYIVDQSKDANWGCIVITGTPTREIDSLGVKIKADISTLPNCVGTGPLPITLFFQLKINNSTSIFKELDKEALNVSLFPNPMTSNTRLAFNMPERGSVTVELFNTVGQKMKTVYSGVVIGEQAVNIPAEGLANGLYFVTLNINQGERIITERLIVNQ
jgi:hypothetical protein